MYNTRITIVWSTAVSPQLTLVLSWDFAVLLNMVGGSNLHSAGTQVVSTATNGTPRRLYNGSPRCIIVAYELDESLDGCPP